MSENITLQTTGVLAHVYFSPANEEEDETGPNVVLQVSDRVSVMINGRTLTEAKRDERGDPKTFTDLAEGKNPIDCEGRIWTYPDGSVDIDIKASDLTRPQARMVAAYILGAAGAPALQVMAAITKLDFDDA